jgi:hypothetical protein
MAERSKIKYIPTIQNRSVVIPGYGRVVFSELTNKEIEKIIAIKPHLFKKVEAAPTMSKDENLAE